MCWSAIETVDVETPSRSHPFNAVPTCSSRTTDTGCSTVATPCSSTSETPRANKLTELNHYDIAGTQPSWVHAEGANVVVELISGERILAAGPGPVDPGPGDDMLEHGWIIDDGPIQVRVDIRYDPISLSLLTRSADSSYYRLKEDNPQSDNSPNDGYVYQISNTGHLLRTFTLKNWGDQMIITRKSTRIYRIKPNS